jgi:hypothetical protein
MAGDPRGDPALRILPPQLELVDRGLELVGSGAWVVVPLFVLDCIPQAVFDGNETDKLAESLHENDSRPADRKDVSAPRSFLATDFTKLTPYVETAASQTRAAAWAKRRAASGRGQAVRFPCWWLFMHIESAHLIDKRREVKNAVLTAVPLVVEMYGTIGRRRI